MNFKKYAITVILLFSSSFMMAGDIAYGTIKTIKVYDFSTSKVTKIYFNSDSTHMDEVACGGIAVITHSLHGEAKQQMLSIALSGYMGGKKVRAYSETPGSCEVDLLSVSDTYL